MEQNIWTAAELEAMSPAERRRISEESVVTDPTAVDPDTMKWARSVSISHIAATEQSPTA